MRANPLILLVAGARFELATFGFSAQRPTRLLRPASGRGKITGRPRGVKPARPLLTFGGGGNMALFSSTSLESGMAAPDFTLPDQHGKRVRLSDLRGKRVVLYFFPKADTPG